MHTHTQPRRLSHTLLDCHTPLHRMFLIWPTPRWLTQLPLLLTPFPLLAMHSHSRYPSFFFLTSFPLPCCFLFPVLPLSFNLLSPLFPHLLADSDSRRGSFPLWHLHFPFFPSYSFHLIYIFFHSSLLFSCSRLCSFFSFLAPFLPS